MPDLLGGLEYTWPIYACAVIAYLLGSIPFGLIITRVAGLGDVRKIGSGNIGATNVLRTGRKELAALTLLLDTAKGAAAVLLAFDFGGPDYMVVAAVAAMVGHMYPIWLRFKGGKGIATGLGVILGISWPAGLAGFGTWLIIVAATRYVSPASVIAAILSVAYVWYFTHDMQYTQAIGVLALLTLFKHRMNMVRLVRGEEPKIGKS
ncbi:MAG: glycerol-3-phosphate 1-O-acyltransferase PlsY [Pseudomonadota bacterium]